MAKWGSLAALEAERERRQERREQRSIASYFQQQQQQQQQQQEEESQDQPPGQHAAAEQTAAAEAVQVAAGVVGGAQLVACFGQEQQQAQAMEHDSAQPADSQQAQQAQQAQAPAAAVQLPIPMRHVPWLRALPPLIAERVCMVPRRAPAAAAQQAQQARQEEQQQQQQQQVPPQAPQAQQAQQQGQAKALQHSQAQAPSGVGRYVLYWMKTAVRGHENPALDAAAAAARAAGLPLVVASFLLSSHPYASARRWTFLLQGLLDAQAELRRQGVELLVYLEGHSEGGAQQAQQQAQQQVQQGQQQAQQQQQEQEQPANEPAQQKQQPVQQQAQQQQGGQQAPSGSAATLSAAGPVAAAAGAADPYSPDFSCHARQGFQDSAGWQALLRLASGAALVLTEDMPVPPDSDWLLALAEQLPAAVQLAAVDTACVLPMRLVTKCHEKAYSFRSASEAQRKQRISRCYPLTPGTPPVGPSAVAPPAASLAGLPALPTGLLQPEALGWAPLELASIPPPHLQQRLGAMLACCAGIDHSVQAVAHLPGGSAAGYARWEAFRKKGLSLYASRRNNAMLRDGVSRLSAYHHWGMVSPFKVSREAAMDRSAGAAKFLDEFLVWREIGFNLCLHRNAQLHSLAALPQWARETLEHHAGDPRPRALPYSQLESGATGDAFWDAAQRQLVKTGELHNNTRMVWGKAFLGWAPSPQAALSALLHANHRWALDGCDPASYSGVLWCFGMYDSPKASADTPVSGCLAIKSTAAAARRVPPVAYSQLPA